MSVCAYKHTCFDILRILRVPEGVDLPKVESLDGEATRFAARSEDKLVVANRLAFLGSYGLCLRVDGLDSLQRRIIRFN